MKSSFYIQTVSPVCLLVVQTKLTRSAHISQRANLNVHFAMCVRRALQLCISVEAEAEHDPLDRLLEPSRPGSGP